SRGHGYTESRTTHSIPLMEPLVARPHHPPREPADVDSSAGTDLRARHGHRTRASERRERSGHLRRESSESLRHARHLRRVADALACPCLDRHVEGVLRGAFLPGTPHAEGVVHQFAELLPVGLLLLYVPADAELVRNPADDALYRRADRGWPLAPDLSRGAP